jgi:hypothetical protein
MPRFGHDHFVGYALRFFVVNDKTVATDFHASPPPSNAGLRFRESIAGLSFAWAR